MKLLPLNAGHTLRLTSAGSMPEQVHVFDESSILAINAALAARRPLLVRGEPGVGKSQLARAAAAALGRVFVQCVVDAHTEPRDLLWRFDAVTRLAEAQLSGALGEEACGSVRERLGVANFLHPGPLWWTFDWNTALAQAEVVGDPPPVQMDGGDPQNGTVLLVDEIDKAESDVPNGLLEALGAGQFTPLGKRDPVFAVETPPLVVITTNEERSLPDAFVRRCLVLTLALPKEEEALIDELHQRGQAHFPDLEPNVLNQAARLLAADRQRAEEHRWRPLPGQAEYLDLLRAIRELAPGNADRQQEVIQEIAVYFLRKESGGDR